MTSSYCGVPDYISPEMILDSPHSYPHDWWSFGCLIFEMVVGFPPFYNKEQNNAKMFQSIKSN